MSNKLVLAAAIALGATGCATVDSFDSEPGETTNSSTVTVKTGTEADVEMPMSYLDVDPSMTEGQTGEVLMPSVIKPETGETYIRKLDSKTGNVTLAGVEIPLMEALKPIAEHGNIELLDSIVDLKMHKDLSIHGMSLERYLLVLEQTYDIEITDHANRLSVAGVLSGVVDAPNSSDDFVESTHRYLKSYAPDKPALVSRIAQNKYLVSGSPNSVKILMATNSELAMSGQQVMIDVLMKTPSGDLYQTQFLSKTEGEAKVPFAGGSLSVAISMDANHQISSSIAFELEGNKSQSFDVIQQSGNRLPLTFGPSSSAYEIAYMVKLVSQLYGE
jgi:hypothetical protein